MKKPIRRFAIYIILILLGAVIGLAASSRKDEEGFSPALWAPKLDVLEFEADEAITAYASSDDIDTRIYALKHFIGFSNSAGGTLDEFQYHDLVLSYGFLGRLYEQKGDEQAARKYYQTGLDIALKQKLFEQWKNTENEIADIDGFRRYLERYERNLKSTGKNNAKDR
jgi:hypothetical protein